MGSYPTSPRPAFLAWCQAHEPIFTTNYAQIGLTSAAALAFKQATDVAAGATTDQLAAKETAKAATEYATDRYADLRKEAADAVRFIRAFAENSADPAAVYVIAQVPAPTTPGVVPPPGQPTNIKVALDATTGEITLTWKCANPPGASGTSYIVRRKLPTEPGYTFVGVTGTKKFVDTTFNAGPDSVQYIIQAQRSGLSGPNSEIVTINFGRASGGGGGGMGGAFSVSTSSNNGEMKMAA